MKTALLNWKWRRLNPQNGTWIGRPCVLNLLSVGEGTYGRLNVYHTGLQGRLVIGNWCSIGPEVTFVLNNEHRMDVLSTFPFRARLSHKRTVEAQSRGGIVVDDDVWFGARATILDGVHIGQGAVVAAGAVVTNDVDPYVVVGGVPARVIRPRFEPNVVVELSDVDLGKLDRAFIDAHRALLEQPMSIDVARQFRALL